MAKAAYINSRRRMDAALLINRLVGTNIVQTYASDAVRDSALPTPANGMVVWNSARNCCQVYDRDFDVWVGDDPNALPIFHDATRQLHHIMPANVRGCVFDGKFFSCEQAAYTDGTRVYAAATATAILMEQGCANGVFASRTIGANTGLAKSADGVAAFADVLAPAGVSVGSLGNSLVDCGGGKLFFITYGSRIYYSADGGDHWGANAGAFDDGNPLITAAANSIDHFHGGFYDATYNRLYVFTGDTNARCSILISSDPDDVAANPAPWSARWGLDDATRSTLNTTYVLGHGVQRYRVIQMIAVGDYIYTGSDGGSYEFGGFQVYRFHRDTLAQQNIYVWAVPDPPATYTAPGLAVGVVWNWGVTSNGTILFSAVSEYATGAYRGACDKYNRLFAILPDGRQAVEIYRQVRSDWAAPSGIAQTYNIAAIGDLIIVTGKNLNAGFIGFAGTKAQIDQYLGVDKTSHVNTYPSLIQFAGRMHSTPAPVNWLPNGRFIAASTGWDAYGDAAVARVTDVVDHGNVASLRVTPGGVGGHARYTLDDGRRNSIRGNMVTASARILLPVGRPPNQAPNLHIRIGASVYKHITFATADFDGKWHEVTVTAYIPPDCTSMSIRLYSNYTTYDEAQVPIYFSDVRLAIGTLALPENSPPVVAVA